MTLLSRLQTLGLKKEAVQGTYLAPDTFIPITSVKPEDVINTLRDESLRGNDTVLQGIYGGSAHSEFDYTIPHLFPDILGNHLRAIIGPDTVTAGVATTLSTTSVVGATTIQSAATIPSGTTIRIGSGVSGQFDYAVTGTPSGAGPFTIPLTATGNTGTGLQYAHASGQNIKGLSTHTFKQDQRATPLPSFSLTHFNGVETRGYPGCFCSDLGVKIDPAGAVSTDAKWQGMPSAAQTATAAAYSNVAPFIGWMWTAQVNNVAATRGLSADYSFKRSTSPLDTSDGTQAPREVFAAALELDLKLKLIFENNNDLALFLPSATIPVASSFVQPLALGGSTLQISSVGQTYTKFATDFSGDYATVDVDASAAFNATDNGVASVVLGNFQALAY